MTKEVVLTKTPVKISDGSTEKYISILDGKDFKWVAQESAPTNLGVFHKNESLHIPLKTVVWAWSLVGTSLAVSELGTLGASSSSNTGSSNSDVIQITDINIDSNAVILKDAPNETELQLVVTPSGANQAITVTDISDPSALQYLEYDAATRTIATRGEYANRDATILVEWEGGFKQFTIPVQLYAQPQSA